MFERYKAAMAAVKERDDRLGLSLIAYVLFRSAFLLIAFALASSLASSYGWLMLAEWLSIACSFVLVIIAIGVLLYVLIELVNLRN